MIRISQLNNIIRCAVYAVAFFLFTIPAFAQPVISSFSPVSGTIGSSVTISGSGFSSTASSNIVFFGGVRANVTSATTTSLVVTVPTAAGYHPISVTTNNLTAIAVNSFTVTFSGGAITSSSFAASIDSTIGESAYEVVTADFDVDGKQDIAVTNSGYPYTISVLKNTSSGNAVSFSDPIILSSATTPFGIRAVDIDGDGKLDLVLTNVDDHSFSVFRNTSTTGTISFAPRTNFPTGSLPVDLAVGDLDGDGKPDVVTSSYIAGNAYISYFRNTTSVGTISFSSRTDLAVDALPPGIAIGDVSNDGKPDIAVVSQDSSTVSVFTNTSSSGVISFAGKMEFITSNSPRDVSFADINNDGFLDIITTGVGGLSVMRNIGSPGVAFGIRHDFGTMAERLALSDFDGDGKADIATSSGRVYKNNSVGSTLAFSEFNFDISADTRGIAIANISADNKPDIITTDNVTELVSVHRNIGNAPSITSFSPVIGGTGSIITITGKNFTNVTGVSFGGVAASSFTVNSSISLTATVASGTSGSVTIVTSAGNDSKAGFIFVAAPTISSFSPTSGVAGTTVSINGSNLTLTSAVNFGNTPAASFTVNSATNISAVIGNGSSGDVAVTTPGGTAVKPGFVFSKPVITSFSPVSGPVGTTVTITGSSFSSNPLNNIVFFGAVRASVVSATATSIVVTVPSGASYLPITVTTGGQTAFSASPFRVTYTGGFIQPSSFATKIDSATGVAAKTSVISDFDGDGKPDVAIGNMDVSTISVFRNTSSGGVFGLAQKATVSCTAPRAIIAGDIDSDGKQDLLVASGSEVRVLKNTSTGPGNISFASQLSFTVLDNSVSLVMVDIDGDGKPDIAAANFGAATFSVLRNTTSGGVISFATYAPFGTSYNPSGIAAGDIDGDGKVDIVVANRGDNNISVFRNMSTSGNISFTSKTDFITSASGFPTSVAMSDLDNDGKRDVIVSNYNSNKVSVFRSIASVGNISFASVVEFSGGGGPEMVQVAEINGDEKPDVILVNAGSNTISIFQNNSVAGNISLAAKVDYSTGNSPLSVSVSDLNNDETPDLVVANNGSNSASVLLNIGNRPSITTFTPVNGGNGTSVTITGINLTGTTAVTFGGTAASSFTVNNATTITAIVATGNTGAVSLITPFGTASRPGFTYYEAPRIDSFSRDSADMGDTVFIYGAYFTGATSVKFNVTPASSFVVLNDTTIRAIVGAGSSGSVNVSTPGGTASLAGFIFWPAPVITSFTPLSAATGATVTIYAKNFSGATVTFGGVPAAQVTYFVQGIWAKVGAGASGQIAITTTYGTAVKDGFIYIEPPTISSFSPTSAAAGTTVTITGTGFTGATAVSFGGVAAASFTVVNSTTISSVVASGSASGNISVTSPGGTVTSPGFIFTSPIIRSFIPAIAGPGMTITIRGLNFNGATGVSFGGVNAASFTVVNDTTITAVTNGNSGNVSVTTPNGAYSLAGFVYTITKPFITSFSPVSGPVGSSVTLQGANFSNILSNNIVFFGGVKAEVISASSSSMVVAVPAGAAYEPIRITTNGSTGYSQTAFALTFSGSGTVFTSNSFAPKTDIATTNTAPVYVNTADINADGKPDVVTMHASQIGLLKNTTNSSISFAQTSLASSSLYHQHISDINEDGMPDLYMGLTPDANNSRYHQNTSNGGNISFSAGTMINFPVLGPHFVSSGDIDGDGKTDLLVASPYTNVVSVLRNNGTVGNFSYSTRSDFATGAIPQIIALSDLNSDGRLDILFTVTNKLCILRNISTIGNIAFAARAEITTVTTQKSLTTGDLDGDSKPEVVVANSGGSSVLVFRNLSSDESISLAPAIQLTTGSQPYVTVLGDMDGDGKADIVTSNYNSNNVSVLRNTSVAGNISFNTQTTYPTGTRPSGLSLGDIDFDGKIDIITANTQSNNISVLRNTCGNPVNSTLCPNGSIALNAGLSGSSYQWQRDDGTGFVNISDNSNYTGTASASLQLTNIPSTWTGYKFRCVVNGNTGDTYSLKFLNAWTGAINGDWENPANWSCGNIPDINTDVVISSGSVIINSNVTIRSLIIQPGVTVTINPAFILTVTH